MAYLDIVVTLSIMQQALEDRPINRAKFVRLNLGLSAFATLNILLLTTSLVTPEGSVDYPARSAPQSPNDTPHMDASVP